MNSQLQSYLKEMFTTTEIYAKANPELKRKYIQAAFIGIIDHPDYDQKQMNDLLNWLKDNI